MKYHERKSWERIQDLPAWWSSSRGISLGEVLGRDLEYAADCMLIIHQWQLQMDFPNDLKKALNLFVGEADGGPEANDAG